MSTQATAKAVDIIAIETEATPTRPAAPEFAIVAAPARPKLKVRYKPAAQRYRCAMARLYASESTLG